MANVCCNDLIVITWCVYMVTSLLKWTRFTLGV